LLKLKINGVKLTVDIPLYVVLMNV